MSESAWELIVKAYERELKNAKTPEEKARWQAAIDQSLTQTNRDYIVSEGSISTTPQEKAARKAAKIEKEKQIRAFRDKDRLIKEGKFRILSPEEADRELINSTFPGTGKTVQPKVDKPVQPKVGKPVQSKTNKPVQPKTAAPVKTPEERQAIVAAGEARKQAAIDAAKARDAARASKKTPVVSDKKTPVISDKGAPDELGDLFDDVIDHVVTEPDESYLASFDTLTDDVGSYIDDAAGVVDDVPGVAFEDLPTVARPSGPDKLASLGTVVDDLTSGPTKPKRMFPGLTAKVQSVLEQTVDLAVDVSNDISKGSSTVGTRTKAVSNVVRKSSTVKEIIKNLDQAKAVVSGLSTKQKTGYTLGALGTIGALSSRRRDERRR